MGIIMYHGAECPHCHRMMPIVAKVEKETGFKFDKKEVWHDEKNADEMRKHKKLIAPACGGDLGTPAFYSTKTHKVICGEMEYEPFLEWVKKNK
jgi:thiol-disulfide isomerase/thioredoxin